MKYVAHSHIQMMAVEADNVTELCKATRFPLQVEPLYPNTLISVECDNFSLGAFSVWSSTHYSGMKATLSGDCDAYVLQLPVCGNMSIDVGRKKLESRPGMGVLVDTSSFDRLTTYVGRSHIGVSIEKSLLTQQLSELLGEPVLKGFDLTDTIDLTTSRGAQIAGLCSFIWQSLKTADPDWFSSLLSKRLLQALMIALLDAVPNNYSTRLLQPVSPAIPRKLKRAIDYMHANAGSNMAIADIAREAGTSVRALQAAFQQFKDTTPLDYLRVIRLQGVRGALMDLARTRSVAEIARDWGFSHMGRFAALYRESFGELPSDTARFCASNDG